MNITFQSWMQAVWISLIEPVDMATKVLTMRFNRDALWSALALVVVLNVLLLALVQVVLPVPTLTQGQMIVLSPFVYVVIIGTLLTMTAFTMVHVGRMMGGTGTLDGSLKLIIWIQVISLTLKVMQVAILMISPSIASLFGMISLGATIWAFVNFINVLHGFANFGKTIVVIVLALIGASLITAFCVVVVMGLFGISPPVGEIT